MVGVDAGAAASFLLFLLFLVFSVVVAVESVLAVLAFFGAAKLAVDSPTTIMVAIAIFFNLFLLLCWDRCFVPHDHSA